MGRPGPAPDVTVADVRSVFTQTAQPCTPLTASEVAEHLECARRTAYRKLEQLADRGDIRTKKTGARSRIWWQPPAFADEIPHESNDPAELAQFGAFVSAVEDYAIFMLDPEGYIISWNEGAQRIKGYTEDGILGEHFSIFYTDDAVTEGVPEHNLEMAATEGRVEDEGWRVRKDDSQFWADVTITAIRNNDGALQGFTKVTRDRTEQREYEQRLRQERNLTEQILETVPVSITVLTPDGEFIRANSRTLDRLGIGEENLGEHSANTVDLYDESGELIPAEGRPWAQVARTGQPVHHYECQVDLPEMGRRWLSLNAAPLEDDRDRNRIVLAVDDITDLKHHERELERRRTELETELSEILGRISDAFYALDEDWCFTHVNERAEGLLERSREALLGEDFWTVFPDAAETAVWDQFHEAMDTQEPVSFEIKYDSLDAWVRINAYPSETGLSVYFQDVTERREYERELERYRTIVETVNDGIYTVGPEGTFTMVNEAYTQMTGYSREELLGSDVSLVIDDDTAAKAQTLEDDLYSGADDQVMIEDELQSADGERVPAEATFALLPADETEYERVGVVRDITERKEQQRALEASERRYRTLVENFPNGAVGLFDEELRYTAIGGQLVDEAAVTPEAWIGSSVHELYTEEIIDEVEPYFTGALQGKANVFEREFRGRHLLAYTLPIRDGTDEVYAGMLVVQDITELKETQRRLEESNERLEQFAYAASHDLQEPLRMVSSYLQLIERRYADVLDEDGQDFLEFAVDGADRMRDMIEGLLQYSRVETRGSSFEPVHLETLLEDVREDLRMKIDESDAEITTDDLPRVKGDASQLREVIQNLISNAIEYSGNEPPRIHISAERTGPYWTVSVADEGIGIDPDDQDQIFEVFQRVEYDTDTTGTGIGLALCERIVERHDGELWVESEPGEGATFSFTLPAVQEDTE